MSQFDFFYQVASSTESTIVNVGLPLWEIILGLALAFFVIFFLATGLIKVVKWLLKGKF